MRIRRLAVVAGAVLALGGSVVTAPPSQACLVPCNLQVKAAGTLLGGGIPADFYGFSISGTFRGVRGFKTVTQSFQSYVGGEGGYNYLTLGGNSFVGKMTMVVVPGIDGAPSVGVITIAPYPGATRQIQGHLTGQIGGTSSVGHLEITGP